MGKSTHYLESAATPEEDSYGYKIEWDDRTTSVREMVFNGGKCEHFSGGSIEVAGYDNAWELYNDYKRNPDYKGVRLIRIDSDGNETVRFSSK